MQNMKVLVSDPLAEPGLALLREQVSVTTEFDLSPEELIAAIPEYDALVVRSGTQVTREVLEAGTRLQVVGRAGVGVDNIDVETATQRGIVVVNTPTGNTRAAAEHTIALMMSLARNVPQANQALRAGDWARKRYTGIEVRDKTIGIIGMGRVGSEVGRRARALGMNVLGYDPFVTQERVQQLGATPATLDDLATKSDFISVHTPLSDVTRDLIDDEFLRKTKPGVRIINCARGPIVVEEALLAALEDGRVAGAALDVFTEEPPAPDNPLIAHPNVVATPHLGASTKEAQLSVSIDVARQVLALLNGQLAEHTLNMPMVPPETLQVLRPFVGLTEKLGSFIGQLAAGQFGELRIVYSGSLAALDTTLLRAVVLKGVLEHASDDRINLVNADLIARRHGLKVSEERNYEAGSYTNLIFISLKSGEQEHSIAGTISQDEPRIVEIGPYRINFEPAGRFLVLQNLDRPGMIGAVGTTLGKHDINIAFMAFGRRTPRGDAIMVLILDESLPDQVADEILAIPDMWDLKYVKI